MFIRFVVKDSDEQSGVAQGIFQVTYDVYYDWRIADYQRHRVRELLDWFEEYLPVPTRFSRRRQAIRNKQSGICWFKDSARQQLQMIGEMVTTLEEIGIYTYIIKSHKLGYIIYEDEFQIIAEPVRDNRRLLL